MARRKDERPIYGQVPLPQPTKETAERQLRKRQLRQPPALAAVIPDVDKSEMKEQAERHAFKKQLRQPPALIEPLPQGQKYRMFKVAWGGLNKTNEIDTGQLSDASNIDMGELPCIVPSVLMKPVDIAANKWYSHGGGVSERDAFEPYPYVRPNGIYAYEDYLVLMYSIPSGSMVAGLYMDIMPMNDAGIRDNILTGVVDTGNYDEIQTIVPFNVYDDTYATISGNTYRRFIVAPYMRGFNIKYGGTRTGTNPNPTLPVASAQYTGQIWVWNTTGTGYNDYFNFYECVLGNSGYEWQQITFDNEATTMHRRFFQPPKISTAPDLEYATSYNSRLFGVGDGRVYASNFGDYAGWTLDTAEEINESNAWVSPAQSNTKASTDFTGITTFRNHVVCFKKDFIHEVYNTKNPFRLVDVYSEGTVDQRTIQDVNGNLFFVSETNVLVYTGGNPRIIGRDLGVKKFTYAVSGADNRRYYLFCRDAEGNEHFYVYDTWTRAWSERAIDIEPNTGCEKVIGFSNNNRGLFMLGGDGVIYKIDSDEYGEWVDTDGDGIVDTYNGVNWWLETEFITRHNLTSSSSAAAMAYSNVNIKHLKSIQLLADVAESKVETVFKDDFQEYDDDEDLADKWVPSETANISLITESGNKMLNLGFDANANVVRNIDAVSDRHITIRFRIRSGYYAQGGTLIDCGIKLGYDTGSETTYETVLSNYMSVFLTHGHAYSFLDKDGNVLGCERNKWYDVKIEYDLANKGYTISLTDESGAEYKATVSNASLNKINRITVFNTYDSSGSGLSIDDISIENDICPLSQFKAYILYDGEKYEEGMTPVYDSNGRSGRLTARIKLRNTAHYGFKLRVQGTGYVKLHEVELYVEDGGTPYLGTGDTAADGGEWL